MLSDEVCEGVRVYASFSGDLVLEKDKKDTIRIPVEHLSHFLDAVHLIVVASEKQRMQDHQLDLFDPPRSERVVP